MTAIQSAPFSMYGLPIVNLLLPFLPASRINQCRLILLAASDIGVKIARLHRHRVESGSARIHVRTFKLHGEHVAVSRTPAFAGSMHRHVGRRHPLQYTIASVIIANKPYQLISEALLKSFSAFSSNTSSGFVLCLESHPGRWIEQPRHKCAASCLMIRLLREESM